MAEQTNRTVLVVDDEALVRAVGSDALADAGYEVLEAGSADEALDLLEQAGEVNVLFTDIRMPGSMDGLALASVVHARWPNIRILVTSGDTWPSALPDDGRFIAKPYRLDQLRGEIDSLAGGEPTN